MWIRSLCMFHWLHFGWKFDWSGDKLKKKGKQIYLKLRNYQPPEDSQKVYLYSLLFERVPLSLISYSVRNRSKCHWTDFRTTFKWCTWIIILFIYYWLEPFSQNTVLRYSTFVCPSKMRNQFELICNFVLSSWWKKCSKLKMSNVHWLKLHQIMQYT